MNFFARGFKYVGCGLLIMLVGWSVLYWQDSTPADEPVPPAFVGALFGGTPARNMVNTVDKNVPIAWSVEEGNLKNIKWSAQLGSKSYAGPLVHGGRVYVGTNNAGARDKKIKGTNKAVLMCFDEKDGAFLWQAVHEFPRDELFHEALDSGLCSTPVAEGKRLYYVTPGCEVICADVADGKTLWRYDMMKELKVVPYHMGNCSPLIVGDLVMVITSNGVSNEENKVASPQAPSFVALDKNKGTIAWKSDLPGENIIEGQWANPAYGVAAGRPQVIFPGGDSIIYSLDPKTGKLLWKCNCFPGRKLDDADRGYGNYFISTPVILDNKVYIGMGVGPGLGRTTPYSHFLCLDMTKSGDVSPKTLNAKDPANKDSALVWAFGGLIDPKPAKGRKNHFGRTISTCAIHDGLVYIAEEIGYFYCLDAKTGEKYWDTDLKSGIWGSPYYVDGKIYIGTDDGEMIILEAGKKEKILARIDMGEGVYSTPAVANGVLYITTKARLYAIAEKK